LCRAALADSVSDAEAASDRAFAIAVLTAATRPGNSIAASS
jgi:hypothetical protein